MFKLKSDAFFLKIFFQNRLLFALWFLGAGWVQAMTPVLSVNGYDSYVVDSSGRLWAWGVNRDGVFGNGTKPSVDPVSVGVDYREVHTDSEKTLALKADGGLWMWPRRNDNRSDSDAASPTPVSPISLGGGYATIPKDIFIYSAENGGFWVRRGNFNGSLMLQMTDEDAVNLRAATGAYVSISSGDGYTVTINDDGVVSRWGYGFDAVYLKSISMDGYRAAGAGRDFIVLLKTDGSLWAWGDRSIGSSSENEISGKPRFIGDGYSKIAVGERHILALKADGALWAWGDNTDGQLGDGTTIDASEPRLIGGGYREIAASGDLSVALKFDGSLRKWGFVDVANWRMSAVPLVVKSAAGSPLNVGAQPQVIEPTELTATAVGDGRVDLTWAADDDLVYSVYRGSSLVATVRATARYSDIDLMPNTLYRYTVVACDKNSICGSRDARAVTGAPSIDLSAAPVARTEVELSWKFNGDTATGVDLFRIYRDETLLIELTADTYRYRDAGLQSEHSYHDYVVKGCAAAGECYLHSLNIRAKLDAQTLPYLLASNALKFAPGWNLMGNSGNRAIDVRSAFGDATKVLSVWKWSPKNNTWAFYTPVAADGGAAFAQSKGYAPLTTIDSGEGFWLNATTAFELTLKASDVVSSNVAFYRLTQGWNLLAVGDNPALRDLYLDGNLPPSVGLSGTTGEVRSVWAWDAARSQWKFYAPSLERQGVLADYIASKGYLPFGADSLAPATGFWMNYRAKDATSGAPQSGAGP